VFFYTIDIKKASVVCSHNDTLTCSTCKLSKYFTCLWNILCYVPRCASSSYFTYFGLCGRHYNSSVGTVKSSLLNVK